MWVWSVDSRGRVAMGILIDWGGGVEVFLVERNQKVISLMKK